MDIDCPVCKRESASRPFRTIDDFAYLSCDACGSLYIAPEVLAAIDRGERLRGYDSDYWQTELQDARQRSRSDALVRSGEAILYAQREVHRFLDIGAGPGYLLDELSLLWPDRPELLHAVEMFPPEQHSRHPNYVVGTTATLTGKFDAGVCIEVIEHLTPAMLDGLIAGLAGASHPDALWLFNTGMPDYVRREDPGYLDPIRRGHLVSYGLDGLRVLFEPHGFRVSALPGKSFAFIAEYRPTSVEPSFDQRFYRPLPANKQLLEAAGLLYQAAFESARSYYFQAESQARTDWALQLQQDVERLQQEATHSE